VSEPTAKVYTDFEFHFRNGAKEYATVLEGRDTVNMGEGSAIALEIHHDDGPVERIEVYRGALASLRTATRTVQPEVRTEDAGSIRLVGVADGR